MVVLDASVVLKWLIDESESTAARALRDCHVRGEELIVVPSLLFYEVANVLRYKENLPDAEIVHLFEILSDLEFSAMHPSFLELREAVAYARIKRVSVYDAAYIVLARKLGCNLITADKRLARAVREPFVQTLSPLEKT